MTKYREILRLKNLGFSERNIALSCGVSRNTVSKVLKRADELNIHWPLDFDMTDAVLEETLFPKDKSATNKRMPDFDYIRKELLRNGVSKKLLWAEYCEMCRMDGKEPLDATSVHPESYQAAKELLKDVSISQVVLRYHRASQRYGGTFFSAVSILMASSLYMMG